MSMVIKNNPQAMMALREANKNTSAATKNLKKLSSGMKINDAGDDASGYAISEKMRAQIRALGQDTQNVQNGDKLLKVGAGGIDNIVSELRTLKELAIKAANDTNSDDDRATIQKEFYSRVDDIEDIAATTTYNGIHLLDGTWYGVKEPEPGMVSTNTVTDMFGSFGTSPARASVNGKNGWASWINGRPVSEGVTNTPYNLDFSSTTAPGGGSVAMPDGMDEQGFFVVCAGNNDGSGSPLPENIGRHPGCNRCHSFKFDADMRSGTAAVSYDPSVPHLSVRVGIGGVTSTAGLAAALYDGVQSLVGTPIDGGGSITQGGANSIVLSSGGDKITLTNNGDGTYSIARNYAIWLYEGVPSIKGDSGETVPGNPLVIHTGPKANQSVNVYINDMHPKALKGLIPNAEDIARLEKCIPDEYAGVYATQLHENGATHPYEKYDVLNSVISRVIAADPDYPYTAQYEEYYNYTSLLTQAKGTTLDIARVTTRYDANVAIRVVDSAIDYALNEATNVGAYISRLGFTEANLVTASENTQAAESTIRDADMAKIAVNFAKDNVLSQSAQAMLAQANQNSSSVLSLLQ